VVFRFNPYSYVLYLNFLFILLSEYFINLFANNNYVVISKAFCEISRMKEGKTPLNCEKGYVMYYPANWFFQPKLLTKISLNLKLVHVNVILQYIEHINYLNPLTPTDLYGMFQIKAWTIPF